MVTELPWKIVPKCWGCYEFDHLSDRAPLWMTQPYPVLMLSLAGEGILYRKEEPHENPVGPDFGRLYYLRAQSIRYVRGKECAPIHMIAFAFELEFENGPNFFDFYQLPLMFPPENEAVLCRELLAYNQIKAEDTVKGRFERQRILQVIVGRLLESALFRRDVALPQDQPRCTAAIKYLNVHYNEPLDIDHLAKLCAMSRPNFFRLFRREMGRTTQEFLCRKRLQEAQKLLLFSDLDIAEIAKQCGWRDPFHFSRLFHRETGGSPSAFRAAARRLE